MDPRNRQSEQQRIYLRIGGATAPEASPIARVLGAIGGVLMFVAAVVVGGVLMLVFLALALAVATAFAVRFWWWRRQTLKPGRQRPVGRGAGDPTQRPRGGTTVDGDYRVVDD